MPGSRRSTSPNLVRKVTDNHGALVYSFRRLQKLDSSVDKRLQRISAFAFTSFFFFACDQYLTPSLESVLNLTVQRTALCDPSRYAAEPFPTYSLDEYQKR